MNNFSFMKTFTWSLLAFALSLPLTSCGGPNSATGAVIGAATGAAVGGIIGHQSGRGLEGAAIGAGLGGVGGAVIGDAQDQENARRRYERERYYEEERRDNYYRGY